ncbi:MAG: hypothetical protein AAFY66_08105 [Pseudomonadota bacterium]
MRLLSLLTATLAALSAFAVAGPLPAPKPEPLPSETRAMLDTLRDAIARYEDFAVAEAEGWRPFGDEEPLMGRHYHLPDGVDYSGRETVPDPARPSNLMYSTCSPPMVLYMRFEGRAGSGTVSRPE